MPTPEVTAVEPDPVDARWMTHALALARRAGDLGEVPVGALVTLDGALIGEGWNCPVGACDPTAHAEIVALRAAAQRLGNYRLPGTTLYCTLEPCLMCVGALVHARVARLVFGAHDPKSGAAGSRFQVLDSAALNHRVAVTGGVGAERCGQLLREFFQLRRGR